MPRKKSDNKTNNSTDLLEEFVQNNIINTKGVVATGFDKGIDYEPMKNKLIDKYNGSVKDLKDLDINDKFYDRKKKSYYN